jgi:uncharacterized membrane protein YdjX (TVP38/TMEM64 family)/rhodanese-related sulfurtransferase
MIARDVARRLGLLALVGGGAVLALLYRDALNVATIRDAMDGRLAPLVFVAAYALGAVLFVPGSLFGLAGGALFGPVWGTLWNLTGALAGAGAAFLIARHVAGDWVARRAAGRLGELVSGIEAEGWRFVAFVRLVPVFPFNLLNYALGLTQIPFRQYMIASALAMLPGTLLYTWIGYAGREALAGGENMPELVLITIALIAAILFIPRIVRRLRARRARWIDPCGLRQLLSRPGSATVIDVRGAHEFHQDEFGRLPEARNIPLPELSRRLEEIADRKADTVVLVCRTHRRSQTAAEHLNGAGFSDVVILRGGMESWSRAESDRSREHQIDS